MIIQPLTVARYFMPIFGKRYKLSTPVTAALFINAGISIWPKVLFPSHLPCW